MPPGFFLSSPISPPPASTGDRPWALALVWVNLEVGLFPGTKLQFMCFLSLGLTSHIAWGFWPPCSHPGSHSTSKEASGTTSNLGSAVLPSSSLDKALLSFLFIELDVQVFLAGLLRN